MPVDVTDRESRDDLYRLAALLSELGRILDPLPRGSVGDYQVEMLPPPPLPPTGAAGLAVSQPQARAPARTAAEWAALAPGRPRPRAAPLLPPWTEPALDSVSPPARPPERAAHAPVGRPEPTTPPARSAEPSVADPQARVRPEPVRPKAREPDVPPDSPGAPGPPPPSTVPRPPRDGAAPVDVARSRIPAAARPPERSESRASPTSPEPAPAPPAAERHPRVADDGRIRRPPAAAAAGPLPTLFITSLPVADEVGSRHAPATRVPPAREPSSTPDAAPWRVPPAREPLSTPDAAPWRAPEPLFAGRGQRPSADMRPRKSPARRGAAPFSAGPLPPQAPVIDIAVPSLQMLADGPRAEQPPMEEMSADEAVLPAAPPIAGRRLIWRGRILGWLPTQVSARIEARLQRRFAARLALRLP
jgi:hypothetical protein